MDVGKLNEEQLRTYLEANTAMLKYIYKIDPVLSSSIKGFRKDHINDNVLINDAFKKITLKKDELLIAQLNTCYKSYIDQLYEIRDSFIKKGYSEVLSLALSMKKRMNKKMQNLYLEINDFDEEVASQIKILIETVSYYNLEEENLKKEILEKIDTKINENHFDPSSLKNELIKTLNKYIKDENLKNEAFENKLNDIEERQNKTEENINKSFSNMSNDIKNIKSDLTQKSGFNEENYVKIDDFNDLMKEINDLKDQIDSLKNDKQKFFKIEKITSEIENEDVSDLNEDIDDIASNFVKGKKIKILRQYILEIIFDKKPVLASKENSIILAKLLSYILTDGTYYLVDLYSDISLLDLFNEIDKITSSNANTVFVFRNIVGTSVLAKVLTFIESRSCKEQYILDVPYEKSIQFLPVDIIKSINYFSGKFELKDPDYIFHYELPNRDKHYCQNYEKIIKELNIPITDFNLYNQNYDGILCFSIIPFISIHDDIDVKKLIDSLTNSYMKEQCKEIFND